jgi:hypothetical protein
MADEDEEASLREICRGLRTLSETLDTQMKEATLQTRRIIAKVKEDDDLVLLPKAPLLRWLTSEGLLDQAYTMEDFLEVFCKKLAAELRLDYETLTICLTRTEGKIFGLPPNEPIPYCVFLKHLPTAFCA